MPKTISAALKAGKFTSRQLFAAFGKAFTKMNDAGKINYRRIARKGQKGYYVAVA